MRVTLEQLMEAVCCERYPKAYAATIYEKAMDIYDKEGCFLADTSYYDKLHEKYGCFDTYLDVYKGAAKQVAEDEMLGRFLVLFLVAIQDKEVDVEVLLDFKRPQTPPGKDPLGYEMVLGLALCSQIDDMAETLRKRGLPEDFIRETIKLPINTVSTHERKHNGEPGFDLYVWDQLYIMGVLFLLDRLEAEFYGKFSPNAKVFQNQKQEVMVLAHDLEVHRDGIALGCKHYEDERDAWTAVVEETENSYIGYPVQENGWISKHKTELDKKEWKLVVEKGDPVIRLHIPSNGKLTPEAVARSIETIKTFAARYFPEYRYQCFTCHSWLMDPQLEALLGAESNITKFMNMFTKVTCKSAGEDVFNFVFNKPDLNFAIEELPENTRLQKALKAHYLNGKAIYEVCGFFF